MVLPRAISWDSPQPPLAAGQHLCRASAALLPQGGWCHLKPCLAATRRSAQAVSAARVFHGVLPPTHGRGTFSHLLGVGRAVSKPAGLVCLQSWLVPSPLTPGCLTKIAAMERGLLTFFFSFSFSFFFSSCAQTSPDLLRRLWHIILQMWHRSLGCKIYPAWQLVVLCNLHQLTETTVRYY